MPLALLALGIVLDLQLPLRAIADVAAVLGTRFSISGALRASCVARSERRVFWLKPFGGWSSEADPGAFL